jgi:hypothetical protein
MAHLGDLVKLAKELIQHHHQLLGGAVAGQPCEAYNVCVQDTERDGEVRVRPGAQPWAPPTSAILSPHRDLRHSQPSGPIRVPKTSHGAKPEPKGQG